ncbi:MAG TPA: hypothetical protein VFD50_00845, partial [Thermoleophilia bacterium]|nr:hypothetical protein [Thermoleophilia bacterium]
MTGRQGRRYGLAPAYARPVGHDRVRHLASLRDDAAGAGPEVPRDDGDVAAVRRSGGHLAWVSGPYTVVFDLTSGKSRLLGIARRTGEAPAASGQYVVWL